MGRERCDECQRVFSEIEQDHPEWSESDRNECAIQSLRNVAQELNCYPKKKCLPLSNAIRFKYQEKNKQEEPEWMKKAREVVELHILDEVHGHPDKWTAYSGAMGCGCANCKRNLEEWRKLYGKRD